MILDTFNIDGTVEEGYQLFRNEETKPRTTLVS